MTEWSTQQQAALQGVDEWLRYSVRPTFYLAGYAGTGKTTLAREVADMVPGRVLFAAYTGKAAAVLRSKGCDGASTLHSLIYKRSEDVFGNVTWSPNPLSDLRGASLLILDECSMVGAQLARDVLAFGTPVLVLGDPAQLPPVDGAGYFTAREPDYLLTEVHRQAEDDPILRLATAVRQGRAVPARDEGGLRFLDARDIAAEELPILAGAAQIIAGTNRNRARVNAIYRDHYGHASPYPKHGETVVVLRNSPDYGVANGEQLQCAGSACEIRRDDWRLSLLSPDGRHLPAVPVELCADATAARRVGRKRVPIDYGYCLTVHKAQGSEWEEVLVWDDGFGAWDPPLRQRWLYTAFTRARTGLTIVQRAA